MTTVKQKSMGVTEILGYRCTEQEETNEEEAISPALYVLPDGIAVTKRCAVRDSVRHSTLCIGSIQSSPDNVGGQCAIHEACMMIVDC